ncbi:FAD/NAD(P)-binding protein [Streptomyces sp. NPDC053429]|uniref:FAD/NAD(P)-binding protein n=1 Tax=Streptomyces sp. NPDC053429 TaxID=3365702 RepID=UPI0037CE9590
MLMMHDEGERTPEAGPTVAVVGAGAGGILTAVNLLLRAEVQGRPCTVLLIDPTVGDAPGPAYRTTDSRHLLNTAAGRMGLTPSDFPDWLSARGYEDVHGYPARRLYGQYLLDLLAGTAARCDSARLRAVPDRITRIGAGQGGGDVLALHGAGGRTLYADAVVLAVGGLPPDRSWAPRNLRSSTRFVPDPWAPGALDRMAAPDTDLLLVGTGLTMADVALTLARPGRVLHAVSRHGLIPQSHTTRPAPPVTPPELDGPHTLDALRRSVLRHVAATRRVHGDWRPALDSLRAVTAGLWQGLSPADRSRFLSEDLRRWETHRHRLAPASAAALERLREEGLLEVSAGQVARTDPDGDGVRVGLRDGREFRVGAVVNCTGPETSVAASGDPLLTDLMARGLARPGPCGLGLDTDPDGRLRPGTRQTGPGEAAPLWTLGALRRGNLFETTAVPEIRTQAEGVAKAVLGIQSRLGARL